MPRVAIKTQLDVVIMRERGMVVIYSPALDLSTCGPNMDEAKRNFVEAVEILYSECLKDGTLEALLTSLGWIKPKKRTSAWAPPKMTHEQIPVSLLAPK